MVSDYQYRIAFFRYPRLFSREGLEPESLACVLVLFFLLTKMMMARWWRFFFPRILLFSGTLSEHILEEKVVRAQKARKLDIVV